MSLFLQFKRPEYRFGANARQYKLWNAPYYRFERTRHQHAVLLRLERNLKAQAVVRYAAPAFDTVAELERAQMRGAVIESSGHVEPCRFGAHKVWTYSQPGTNGIPNPNGRPFLFESFASVFDAIGSRGRNGDALDLYRGHEMSALRNHLEAVARVCGSREPGVRAAVGSWAQGLPSLEIDPDTVRTLTNFAVIQSLMSRMGAAWWLAG